MKRTLLLAGIWLAHTVPALAAEAKPTNPAAPAPSVTYRSAFEGYRPFQEQPIADWRALNAEVGAAGGHIGIMGGAGGHASPGGGAAKPAAEGGQAPVRSAPKAPASGAHGGH